MEHSTISIKSLLDYLSFVVILFMWCQLHLSWSILKKCVSLIYYLNLQSLLTPLY